jgi:hypothetical protein
MLKGSQPTDGQHLIVEPEDFEHVSQDPIAARYLRRLIGAETMLSQKYRHCFWLTQATPADLAGSPVLRDRLKKVIEMRLGSATESVRDAARIPALFTQIRQPTKSWLAIPRHSSENRRVIPMAFYGAEDIAHDSLLSIDGADRYLFGILQSRPFALWAGTVSGRLGSGVRISPDLSYNSFPLPEATADSKKEVVAAADEVLVARESANATLEDLYDSVAMPPALVRAHDQLDSAVVKLFGLKDNQPDAEVLAALFTQYEALVAPMGALLDKKKGRSCGK